jgi:hypothetical protein
MTPALKVRENTLRRLAERRGFRLERRRRYDRHAWDYGLYRLVDIRPGAPDGSKQPFTLTLDDAAAMLTEDDRALVA